MKYDPETGLYHYRARAYDAESGRFLQHDPVYSANPYPYVNNDPVNNVDPHGEFGLGLAYGAMSLLHDINMAAMQTMERNYRSMRYQEVKQDCYSKLLSEYMSIQEGYGGIAYSEESIGFDRSLSPAFLEILEMNRDRARIKAFMDAGYDFEYIYDRTCGNIHFGPSRALHECVSCSDEFIFPEMHPYFYIPAETVAIPQNKDNCKKCFGECIGDWFNNEEPCVSCLCEYYDCTGTGNKSAQVSLWVEKHCSKINNKQEINDPIKLCEEELRKKIYDCCICGCGHNEEVERAFGACQAGCRVSANYQARSMCNSGDTKSDFRCDIKECNE